MSQVTRFIRTYAITIAFSNRELLPHVLLSATTLLGIQLGTICTNVHMTFTFRHAYFARWRFKDGTDVASTLVSKDLHCAAINEITVSFDARVHAGCSLAFGSTAQLMF